ncbi:MAG: hypothetical protein ACR2JC_07855 [Chloroflexota bacterium]
MADPVALAAAIRQAALGVPGVAAISSGRGFLEATYGRSMTVRGVGVGVYDGRLVVSVHIVTVATPIPILARRLRDVVGSVMGERAARSPDAIDVYVDDIVLTASDGQDGSG